MKELSPLANNVCLTGLVTVPADKSIAQRSIIFAGIAKGKTEINNFPLAGDPQSTLQVVESLGVKVNKNTLKSGTLSLEVFGEGINGLKEPENILDCGNSGTGLRLMMGLLAGLPTGLFASFTGDASLRSRPMKRVIEPLKKLGAQIWGRSNGTRAPLCLIGKSLSGGQVENQIASAQLKSALILSCLNAQAPLTIKEPALSRNHTEIMLKQFGAKIANLDELTVKLEPSELQSCNLTIPGDISSAAFLLVAASIIPGSEIQIQNVGLNPTRTGIVEVLKRMGASIEVKPKANSIGEQSGDIVVRSAELQGVEIAGDIIPNVIDELPILSLAAAQAKGTTIIKNAEELRVKESDRLKAMAKFLTDLGVKVEERPDGMIIEGLDGKPFEPSGTTFDAGHDHRIAMTVGIASLRCTQSIKLDGAEWANVSFPGFFNLLQSLSNKQS
jgi:3-phosphoshikimate 1-carboxyvinyltransferase